MKTTKAVRKAITAVVVGLMTVGMTLNFSGCSKESTMGPTNEKEQSLYSQNAGESVSKALFKGKPKKLGNYPQSTTCEVVYSIEFDRYSGAKFNLNNGSSFRFPSNSLIPSSEIPWDQNVTLTWSAEKNDADGEII